MNKVYKLVWNASLGMFVVVSELAKGRCKTKRHKAKSPAFKMKLLMTCMLATLSPEEAFSTEKSLGTYTPEDSAYSLLNTDTTLVQGSGAGFAGFAKGKDGYTELSLAEAYRQNNVIEGAEYLDSQVLRLGSKTSTVAWTDSITKNTEAIPVYNNDDMYTYPISDYVLPMQYSVGVEGQYVDKNLFQVSSGATVTVDVGNKAVGWMNDPANALNIILKSTENDKLTSSVFNVSEKSKLEYNSKTIVELGNYKNTNKSTEVSFISGFKGEVKSLVGNFTINNLDDFKAYNTALCDAIQAGTLAPALYDNEVQKAIQLDVKKIVVAGSVTDPNDAINHSINRKNVAYIASDNSAIHITSEANIQLVNSDATLINLENSASLNNEGTIGSALNTLNGSTIVRTLGSHVENNGVIDVGTYQELTNADKFGTISNISVGENLGIEAMGNSVVINQSGGIMNIASRQDFAGSLGIRASDSAMLKNSGTINVAATEEPNKVNGDFSSVGVVLSDAARFDNEGTIYIGREAQRNTTDAASDIVVKSPGTIGVLLENGGIYVSNGSGNITIGSLTQGATGIAIKGPSAKATISDLIDINGASVDKTIVPQKNIGIKVSDGATDVESVNIINVNGINGTGISVSKNSAAENKGAVVVQKGVDSETNTANYGLWAEGDNAVLTNSGSVVLLGDGAIGIHARDQGTVNQTQGGRVQFLEGKNQTGFFIFGRGSSVNDTSSSKQDVTTEGSTLYRIDGGALFNGSDLATADMTASGVNSTILLVTGVSDDGQTASTLNTGSLNLNVDATGATAVRVEGGAIASLDRGVSVLLNAANTTAGIVDGRSTTVTGLSGRAGSSQLTSYAKLDGSNTAPDAIGYITRNDGTLIHKGELAFTADNSTGILVEGGNLDNAGTIGVNGVAIDIIGGSSRVSNSGTVTATGGTAAYRLQDGASLSLSGRGVTNAHGGAHGILIESPTQSGQTVSTLSVNDATLNVTGAGNAIENAAGITGIRLVSTQLNVENGSGIRSAASLGLSNSGVINVAGKGQGILLTNADGSSTTADLNLLDSDGLNIYVRGAEGRGIVTNTSGDVKNGTNIDIESSSGGAALVTHGSTKRVIQKGVLKSSSTTTEVVNIDNGYLQHFSNEGAIIASDKNQVAVSNKSGEGITFNNSKDGVISGQVNLLSGNNTVNLFGGSSATDFNTGSGDDIFNLVDVKEGQITPFSSLNAGAGQNALNLSNSAYTLNSEGVLAGFQTINLKANSSFTQDNVLSASGSVGEAAALTFNIEKNSVLNIRNKERVSLNNHIAGDGTINVAVEGQQFGFTENNKNDGFSGILELHESTFNLQGINTEALRRAHLKAASGNLTTIGEGMQTIGGLSFDGGTADFGQLSPGIRQSSASLLTTDTLDIQGKGTIQVALDGMLNDAPVTDNALSLLEQDDANVLVKIAGSSGSVIGSGGNLELIDRDGNLITDSVQAAILQGGENVAQGLWDYRLTGGMETDGLYINYGLKEVELIAQGDNALLLSGKGGTGAAGDLSARLTGAGDLHIDGSTSAVSLSNSGSDYRGKTVVRAGVLYLAADDVLGKTQQLDIHRGAVIDVQGFSQTTGALVLEEGGLLHLSEDSKLLITDANQSAKTPVISTIAENTLQGKGTLSVQGSQLDVAGNNSAFTGNVTLTGGSLLNLVSTSGLGDSGTLQLTEKEDRLTLSSGIAAVRQFAKQLAGFGQVDLNDQSDIVLAGKNNAFSGTFNVDATSKLTATDPLSLGSAAINNRGMINLTANKDWELTNAITGAGELVKEGDAALIINHELAHTGQSTVNRGTMIVGNHAGSTGTLSGKGNVVIEAGATLGGLGDITGHVMNRGTVAALNALTGYESEMSSQLKTGSLSNSGTINLAGKQPGNTLNVNGDYIGNNGLLKINTTLGKDGSATDKMVVAGSTAGDTHVQVNNMGGAGAQTSKGINIIEVGGRSSGQFTLDGRAVAGAYEYFLNKGNQGDGNWYLQSSLQNPVTPVDPVDPVDPVKPVEPKKPSDPIRRPEAGAYTANIAAANTLFVTSLHDRLGETTYTDVATGEEKVTSMWMRNVGRHIREKDSSGQLKTQNNQYVLQIGGDIASWGSGESERFHLGLMAGYGNNHSNTDSSKTGYSARGSVNGYSVGGYFTWYENEKDETGGYVDSWLLYNWFNNSVKGEKLAEEKYKSSGVTASIETGIGHKIGSGKGSSGTPFDWYIQPQLQAVWMNVNAQDHTEANGTRVKSGGQGNLMTRLGARTFLKGHSSIDEGKGRTFQPFVEANWLHNSRTFNADMNGVTSSVSGTKNMLEIKAGVEGKVNQNLNVWGSAGNKFGSDSYSETSAMIGVKYSFK
ncbi:autotransporter outer membrane beta-barrel domain-containing protein [Enterobacter quasiroggenkampii]|nr:autotransporter outer membrane beta-barrel domain-containing protein [Enterobacter quasiroggenkampii]MCU6404276.1 autotransporter outer membrane beta-barrel domain-containing protein [Enterobacter quasiroggenkampii]